MNVFDLDKNVIRTYESFSRSFAKIRAEDLQSQISETYDQGTFWPELKHKWFGIGGINSKLIEPSYGRPTGKV